MGRLCSMKQQSRAAHSLLSLAEPQRHLLCVQWLRAAERAPGTAAGKAGVAEHRGGVKNAARTPL